MTIAFFMLMTAIAGTIAFLCIFWFCDAWERNSLKDGLACIVTLLAAIVILVLNWYKLSP